MKTLVVFYSRTGNTRRVAKMIARQLGADVQELMDRKGRDGFLGWIRAGRDAIGNRITDLEPLRHNPGDYDLIVVGTPVWASHPAPAVRTFLESTNLSDKKVALFCTMNARGGEETRAAMEDLIPGAKVVGHLAVAMKRESEDQINEKVIHWTAEWKT